MIARLGISPTWIEVWSLLSSKSARIPISPPGPSNPGPQPPPGVRRFLSSSISVQSSNSIRPAESGAAAVIARRLCESLPSGRTCSGGIAEWTGREPPFDLMARADAALYEAKRGGRNQLRVA